MKYQKIYVLIVLVGMISLKISCFATTALATEFQEIDYRVQQELVSKIKNEIVDAKEVYGEIVGINRDLVLIKTQTGEFSFKLSDGSRLFCNNLVCNWEALQPVAADAFFEAQIVYNEKQEAIVLNSFYYGAECLLLDAKKIEGQIILVLENLETGKIGTWTLNIGANFLWRTTWLPVKQVIYVLFSMNGGIRALFLVNTA